MRAGDFAPELFWFLLHGPASCCDAQPPPLHLMLLSWASTSPPPKERVVFRYSGGNESWVERSKRSLIVLYLLEISYYLSFCSLISTILFSWSSLLPDRFGWLVFDLGWQIAAVWSGSVDSRIISVPANRYSFHQFAVQFFFLLGSVWFEIFLGPTVLISRGERTT